MKVNIAGRPLDPSLCVGVGVVLGGVLIYYLVDIVSGRASLARKRARKRQERDHALSTLADTLQQNKVLYYILCFQVLTIIDRNPKYVVAVSQHIVAIYSQ